jgi:3-oxoacyl-[acyl-carrier-protein] synthase-3
MISRDAYLTAITYHLPDFILTNEIIHQLHPEWSIEKIASKTGISNRYIAGKNECSSDLAEQAATKLFKQFNVRKEEFDYLILCTQTPDYFLPTTACILQDRLGLPKTSGALDINLGCSGFVYGLGLAKGLIASGQANRILFITAETYSKFIDPSDKSNKTLFGDAAAACIIETEKREGVLSAKIGNFKYGTDGSGYQHLIVRRGGFRYSEKSNQDIVNSNSSKSSTKDDFLFMDGKEIFNFTAFEIPLLLKSTLESNSLSFNDISLYVLHQANEFMLQTIRKRSGIDKNKFYTNLSFGNTVSSTIPIALNEAINENRLATGDTILIAGFGVGLSMGGTVLYF